jgi:muconolactone delta-isomerase
MNLRSPYHSDQSTRRIFHRARHRTYCCRTLHWTEVGYFDYDSNDEVDDLLGFYSNTKFKKCRGDSLGYPGLNHAALV